MRYILFLLLFSVGFVACKKVEDTPGAPYAGQDEPYCNDPEAINYNYNFPGTANNTTCIYPTDPFVGSFALMDSIFTADFASFYIIRDTVNIYALSNTQMAVVGFCGPYDSIKLTARSYYKASIDTTILNGQPLCTGKDTISGSFKADSIGIRVEFTLYSDTAGNKFHKGTGTRIQ